MMPQLKPATLATIFSEILASLAFMFTEEEAAEDSPEATWIDTSISYEGPTRGTLRLRCTRDFAVQLAATLLGMDPLDDEARRAAEDAVKEFMNILCGQFVTTVHGTGDSFNLTIPQIEELPQMPDLSAPDSPVSSSLCVDGFRVQVVYEPETGSP
jgi:CheY-specific phosphatase CheX